MTNDQIARKRGLHLDSRGRLIRVASPELPRAVYGRKNRKHATKGGLRTSWPLNSK